MCHMVWLRWRKAHNIEPQVLELVTAITTTAFLHFLADL